MLLKKVHHNCFLYFFSILGWLLNPAQAQVLFTPVSAPDGTSWGQTIGSITQDHQGYMWFASFVGLHRYDGYHLVSYTHDPTNPNSIASNLVRTLFTDHKGNIWVGHNGAGLDKMNPATGVFTHYKSVPSNPHTLDDNSIRQILEDKDGMLWVGTDKGLNRMDVSTGRVERFQHKKDDSTSLTDGPVTAIYEDKRGTLWVGTARGISLDEPCYGGLNKVDKKSGRFTRYVHDTSATNSLIDDRVTALFEDNKNNFWVGTSGHGLHLMNRSSGTFQRIPYNSKNNGKLGLPAPTNKNSIYEYVTFISQDAAGALWLGTFENGIYRYDLDTKQSSHFKGDTLNGFLDGDGWRAYNSREGVFWISTIHGSLYRIDPLRALIPFYSTKFQVAAILADEKNKLWMGSQSGGGLLQMDAEKKTTKSYVSDSSKRTTLSNNLVETLYKDHEGNLWVGTQIGLNKFDEKGGTFTRYLFDANDPKSLTKGHTHAIYEDHQGMLWIGTQEGLNRLNKSSGTFTRYVNDPADSTTIGNNSITDIMEDKAGALWVGTSRGLNKWDRKTGRFKHYLPGGISVSSLLQDGDGVIWVGALGGLYRYNAVADNFLLFNDFSAGLTSTMAISHIMEDSHKNIWGSMVKYIFKINSKRNEVSVYGKNNGLKARNPATAACKGPDGKMYFGFENGYCAFDPEQFTQIAKPPQVVISDFRISDKEVVPGKKSPLKEPVSIADEIHLKYYQNDFSFDFVGIHFSNPDDNRHFYMLEGLDNNWRKAGSEKIAYYYNVPPGKYTFKVKAASSEGVWAEKDIAIIIGNRWWLTWWAYTIYALVAALVIWLFVENRSRRLRLKNKMLEERVAQRTTELKYQKEELQNTLENLRATQTQLIQKEKMASLGELTAGIAHEIQNPLNFINNFSDLNTEILEEMKGEINNGNPSEAIALADSIMANNEKITYHGKRADAIVKGMLQHSRQNSGVKETIDINALTDEYLRLSYHGLRATNKNFNAALKTYFDPAAGKISIIPQDLGRVFLNLFNNAFYSVNEKKISLNGTFEPTVTVTTKRINGKIEIKVTDNGNGIAPKSIDKIFQPFFTTKPSGQGTGLGLSLSYDIITKGHGGEIKVDTKEGEYTAFTILLPA